MSLRRIQKDPGSTSSGRSSPEPRRRLSLDSSWGRALFSFHPPSEPPQLRTDGSGVARVSYDDELRLAHDRATADTTVDDDTQPSCPAPPSNDTPEASGHPLPSGTSGTTDSLLNLEHWSDLSQQFSQEPSLGDNFSWAGTYQLVLAAMEYGVKIVDNKRVQYSELIGAGANMTVFRGNVNGKTVALKRIRPFHNETRQKRDLKVVLASLEMEIRVMSDVFLKGHENIAKLLAFTWETAEDGELVPVLIMDLAAPGCSTLEQFMQQVDPRDFDSKAWMISDIVSGLTAIHEEKIVHGDLKPENILLFRRETAGVLDEKIPVVAKISDFGFCEDVHEDRGLASDTAGGTEYWNAPECMPEAPDDIRQFARMTQRDMYSCGLIIWYVLSSTLPLGPTSGPEWEKNRQSFREGKLNGEVQRKYRTWFLDSLKMVIATQDDANSFNAELEDELPVHEFSYRMMIEKIKRDPLFKTQVIFDELLFRDEGRAAWRLKTADGEMAYCSGYLPVMAPVVVMNMLRPPDVRLGASAALPMVQISRNRKPAKIYAFQDRLFVNGKRPGERQGWQEWASRFRGTFASARMLQTLTPEMHASLLRELHKDADGPSGSVAATLILHQIYGVGYGVPVDLALSEKYATKGIEMTENTRLGDAYRSIYMTLYYKSGWFRDMPLDAEKELKWSLKMFSSHMDSETESRTTLSRDSFEDRLALALDTFEDWNSVTRFLRISSSAYIDHQRIKESNRTDPILRQPEVGHAVPDLRGNWVNTLLSDEPAAFEALQVSGALPEELRLDNEDMDSILFMMIGMYNGPGGREQMHANMISGMAKREKALNNLLRICAEHGLTRLMKHLTTKHNLDINRKLDSGRNPIQEVLEQGRTHRAISLLASGADLAAIAEKDFIRHICGDGHYKAIDFWSQLKRISDQLLWLDSSNWLLIEHYQKIFKLFGDNENLNLDLQAYQTYGAHPRGASPIYFSIVENCWLTFLALLRYGVDPARPCMGSLDALQSSVLLIRPVFVATLCGPEYEHRFHTGEGAPSLLHLAALGKGYFSDDKMWVYLDENEIRDDPEEAKMDQPNHQRLILELLWRNLRLDLESRDEFGLTPFLLAVLQNNAVAAEWFEKKGSNVNASAADGCSALHLAIASGSDELVEYVLGVAGHLLEEKDATGQTPLHFASCQSGTKILSRILNSRPNLEATDVLGRTAFFTSISHGQVSNFDILVRVGHGLLGRDKLAALLNAKDESRCSCFHLLATLKPDSLQSIAGDLPFDLFSLLDGDSELSGADWTAGRRHRRVRPGREEPLEAVVSSFQKEAELREDLLARKSCLVRSRSRPVTARVYLPEFNMTGPDESPGT
ncbi:uncharacterized protein NECHADRAFT_85596 [Fusarium vanettenii 77-13-4]|uniref:Protein kinase domain-containing protein n=1 Tax=Fusarium vanettenii (strain ATCC MYA-4622 / CBS 123669 / FGSC 9596 / NRRL 45880 / 77-13-4) TaxID=660122 RepID=C7ZP50_FUSV7|nr:uncharacterized protein NECHADRAFT_85596 [Fusarium vanettenii 77-13-4]EEU34084.1 hypothetical protein NECHADRAFT_85596 [Fusarium vanettenii 77-13-4]